MCGRAGTGRGPHGLVCGGGREGGGAGRRGRGDGHSRSEVGGVEVRWESGGWEGEETASGTP